MERPQIFPELLLAAEYKETQQQPAGRQKRSDLSEEIWLEWVPPMERGSVTGQRSLWPETDGTRQALLVIHLSPHGDSPWPSRPPTTWEGNLHYPVIQL